LNEHDDLDRLRAAFAQPDEAPHPESCPSLSEIWEGVHGRLLPDRLRDVVEHLTTCSPCAEAWRLALLMEQPAGSADGRALAEDASVDRALDRLERRPRWRLYGAVATVAAAAVLAAVLGLGFHDFRRGAAPPTVIALRGGGAGQATATRWIAPGAGATGLGAAALPRSDVRLRWTGVPGASYDLVVEIEDESGAAKPVSIAAARGLGATEYIVPAQEVARVPPGAVLHATLTAHLPDGRSEGISRDFRVR
jgi:hypothetical protein